MANYRYKAKNSQGESVTGTLNAQSETEAVGELRRQGLIVLSLDHKRGGSEPESAAGRAVAKSAKGGFFSFSLGGKNIRLSSVRVKTAEMVIFTRQLSTMISAG